MRVFRRRVVPTCLLVLLLAACQDPPYPDGTLQTLYPQPPRPHEADLAVAGRTVHYVRMDAADAGPRIVFIHGSPGDWKAYARYLSRPELQAFGPLISVDRPGYGGSGARDMVPSLAGQADLLAPLLDDPHGPVILVGHSLGGPIAAKLAMDHPDKVRGVLLIAGSVDPDLEAPRWYNRVARWRVVQWLIPDELVDSNRELFDLQDELRRLEPGWKTLRAPVTVVQGDEDALVDPRTADYLDAQLAGRPHRILRVPGIGHFVIWERMDLVTKALVDLVGDGALPESSTADPSAAVRAPASR